MTLNEAFKKCAVLGAVGKMGRGISCLVLQEMAFLEAKEYGSTGTGNFKLVLIDPDAAGYPHLKSYLRKQLTKYAEKMVIPLRTAFLEERSLTSNSEIINSFVEGALDNVQCSSLIEEAGESALIFEALPESIELKVQSLEKLKKKAQHEQYYFSNTSSIPIWLINTHAGLDNRAIGLHFYNPPVVQKLMELSIPEGANETAKEYAIDISKRFGKTIVYTADLPGFIGNGFFMHEVAFASSLAERLLPFIPLPAAIYAVDILTRDFLIRPMGIFQLVDYVGSDVCENIALTIAGMMNDKGVLAELVFQINRKGMKGGPGTDGTQKEGFFRYGPKSSPIAVYDFAEDKYIDLQDPQIARAHELLGPLPEGHATWKSLEGNPNVQTLLNDYFAKVASTETLGCMLSTEYLRACNQIAQALVDAKVANSAEDVNTVMKLGFHQLYGPLESWIEPILRKEVQS